MPWYTPSSGPANLAEAQQSPKVWWRANLVLAGSVPQHEKDQILEANMATLQECIRDPDAILSRQKKWCAVLDFQDERIGFASFLLCDPEEWEP
jgi:hypothetical protein